MALGYWYCAAVIGFFVTVGLDNSFLANRPIPGNLYFIVRNLPTFLASFLLGMPIAFIFDNESFKWSVYISGLTVIMKLFDIVRRNYLFSYHQYSAIVVIIPAYLLGTYIAILILRKIRSAKGVDSI